MFRIRAGHPRALLAFLIGVVAALGASRMIAGSVRTEDRNGDGRPDVWRAYDQRGRPIAVSIDTNFDGRPDVREYYAQGNLIRRESDRHFNDQVDLVEDFDPVTHEHIRSVVDVNDDGIADLLVLFQGGQAVFSKWAPRFNAARQAPGARIPSYGAAAIHRAGNHQVLPLLDPFQADIHILETHGTLGSDICLGLPMTGSLAGSCIEAGAPVALAAGLVAGNSPLDFSTVLSPRSPRGPPLS